MKKISMLFLLLLAVKLLLFAQEQMTVRFTGITEFGLRCPFDEIIATNETRGWTDTLIYPDTVLTLRGSVGIDEHKTEVIYLGVAYPNPFNDNTIVPLEIYKASDVLLRLVRVDGSEVLARRMHLEAGTHSVTVMLSFPQVAFLSVTTSYGMQVAKLVNTSHNGNDAITVDFISPETEILTKRLDSDASGEFEPGDIMRYEALLFDYGMTHHSFVVRQSQYIDQTITLTFALNKSSVSTSEVSNISHTTATCGGLVNNDGGLTVTERGVCWGTSYNPTTNNSHSIDGMGTGVFTSNLTGLTAGMVYYVRAYSVNRLGTSYGSSKCFITEVEHDWVDLGLPSGLLWATCNVGASNPESYGSFFAWGETQPKSFYSWETYQYCNGNAGTITKYCNDPESGYNGYTDDLTVLLPEDDAASINWGGDWRMPTAEEWQELLDNTTGIWTIQNEVRGFLFSAPNGNSIFLPAGGFKWQERHLLAGLYGHYWSSSLGMDESYESYNAIQMDFFVDGGVYVRHGNRDYGYSVRPVRSAN